MKITTVIVLLVALATAARAMAESVEISQAGTEATLQNVQFSVTYDLAKGTFAAQDRNDHSVGFVGACTQVGSWSSATPGCKHAMTSREVHDDLGTGKTLTITSTQADAPNLILEITLYQDGGFMALAAGIENTLDHEIVVKEFYPLHGGRILPDGALAEAKTLDGPTGCRDTNVRPGAFRSSPNNLLLTFTRDGNRRALVAGGLTYHEFLKFVTTRAAAPTAAAAGNKDVVFLDLRAADPVGKRVDAGKRYVADDKFYVDFTTRNPFEALEQYGRKFRVAQKANPNPYDFPEECEWYVARFWGKRPTAGGGAKYRSLSNTKGMVEEMDAIKGLGFLKYSRVALRLLPDRVQMGWWDDAHSQKAGFFVLPYETAEKWGKAIHERGGLPGLYLQPMHGPKVDMDDFAKSFPNLMLAKDVKRALDYTNPDTQAHMKQVYAAMRAGGINTLMFDYCDTLWGKKGGGGGCPIDRDWDGEIARGGFVDNYATASSCYRTMLSLAKEGLGPDSWIHERALANPGSDIAVGISDSQRTEGDNDVINPTCIAKCGLRWYKNRVVIAYDKDAINLLDGWKRKGFTGTDQDGRRMMLTMAYVAVGRLLLANTFRELSAEATSDLERTVSNHTAPQSARPVDAFVAKGWPSVYDFAVNPQWHQLTLVNNTDPTVETQIVVPLSGDTAAGALGLDPAREYYLYDFWNNRFAGKFKGCDSLRQTLRPGEARMFSIHQIEPNPQFLSTNRHIMQGYVDMAVRPKWDAYRLALSGTSNIVGGETYKVVIAINGHRVKSVSAPGVKIKIEPLPGNEQLAILAIDSTENATVAWMVKFENGN